MNLEELQAMSDEELNELSAVRVMVWERQGGLWINTGYLPRSADEDTSFGKMWNPTTDMNDAYSLLQSLIPIRRVSIGFNISGWDVGLWAYEGDKYVSDTNQSLPRAITIASILAKESETL